jgi:4-amino-4-deoxy-L-arabinose transferase-like glycosyltransferase
MPFARVSPIVLVGALAGLIRLLSYDSGYYQDEYFTFRDVAPDSISGVLHQVIYGPEVSPPLYFVIQWPFSQAVGPGLFWHVPNLLFGVGLVLVTYRLAERCAGRRAAIFAGLMAAFAPSLIFYSNELRPYSLLGLFVCLSTLALSRAVEQPGRRWWIAYAIFSAASVWTHYSAGLALAGQGLVVLIVRRDVALKLIGSNVLAFALFAPWLAYFKSKDTLSYYGKMDWSLNKLPFVKILPGEQGVPLTPFLKFDPASIYYPVWWLLFAAVFVIGIRRTGWRKTPFLISVSLGISLGVLGGMALASEISGWQMYTPRHVLLAVPYLLVIFGWGISQLKGKEMIMAWLALGIVFIGGVRHFTPAANRPPVWQASVRIKALAKPNDLVIERTNFTGSRMRRPLRFAGVSHVVLITGRLTESRLAAAYRRGSTAWVLTSSATQKSLVSSLPTRQRLELAGFTLAWSEKLQGTQNVTISKFVPSRRKK